MCLANQSLFCFVPLLGEQEARIDRPLDAGVRVTVKLDKVRRHPSTTYRILRSNWSRRAALHYV